MRAEERPFSGAKLQAAREAAGHTREELGVIVGRTSKGIYLYETGRHAIPLICARAFAAVLHVELDDLRADPPKPERKSRRAAKAR